MRLLYYIEEKTAELRVAEMRLFVLLKKMINKKTNIYIDGFNLYFLSLKNTNYKWLDVKKLCSFYFPNNNIQNIKYFTADIKARLNEPDKHIRQQIYLRALKTIPEIEIIKGYYQEKEKKLPLIINGKVAIKNGKVKTVKVLKSEEKGSDVNLASYLLKDAYEKNFDEAIIVSNDSDLMVPITIVIKELMIPVHILNPDKNSKSDVFKKVANSTRKIQNKRLKKALFDNRLEDSIGIFTKPTNW